MKVRKFGNTDRMVSEIGLGCWQLGGDWGRIDDYTAQKVMEAAVENGISFFDTADAYGGGRSEKLLYKYLKPLAPESFIATKLGRFEGPDGLDKFSFDDFRRFTENSLKRLGVEALDLTQLHCFPTGMMKKGEVFDWLRKLKQEGKIRSFGASVESVEEAELCLEQEGLDSLQIIFSIFRQKPITSIFDQARDKGVALIIRLPLASGLLAGRMHAGMSFPESDHRHFNSDGQCFNVGETFAGIPFKTGLELLDELKTLVPGGLNLAQMALRWILDYDAVTVVIPGSKTPGQVPENASASQLAPLPEALHEQLNRFYHERVARHIRGKY